MKKMIRQALMGFGMSIGMLMVGLDPASAATLKDSNNNPIIYGEDYYLSPYTRPDQGLAYTKSWNINWARLGPGPGEIIRVIPFYNNGDAEGIGEVVLEGDQIKLETDKVAYDPMLGHSVPLYFNVQTNSIEEREIMLGFSSVSSEWILTAPTANMDPEFASKHYFGLKNTYHNRYLYALGRPFGEEDWLKLVGSEMNSNVMWRLIKK